MICMIWLDLVESDGRWKMEVSSENDRVEALLYVTLSIVFPGLGLIPANIDELCADA